MSIYGHDPYYHGLLKNYVSYFGRIFSNIRITRNDPTTGNQTALIRVPLDYSGRDKNLLRAKIQPGSEEELKCPPGFLVFPHLGFELTSIAYDPDRNMGIMGKRVAKDDANLNKLLRQWNPAPYNFGFSLYVMSKNIEDSNKIVEQILPFFRPTFTSSLLLIPEIGIVEDIPITLDAVNFEDQFRGELTERRNVFWTLTFTMHAYMHGPVLSKPIVKVSNTNIFAGEPSTTNTAATTISVTPGLDANGAATSNASATIPYANIAVDDTFGYIVSWTDETDSLDQNNRNGLYWFLPTLE